MSAVKLMEAVGETRSVITRGPRDQVQVLDLKQPQILLRILTQHFVSGEKKELTLNSTHICLVRIFSLMCSIPSKHNVVMLRV